MNRGVVVVRLCLDGAFEIFMCSIHILTNCRQEGCVFFEDERVSRFECDSSLEHALCLVGIAEFGYEKDCIVAKNCGVGWICDESLFKYLLRLIEPAFVL